MTDADAIQVRIRLCWVRKDNLRLSSDRPWPEPCWETCIVEWVEVHESMRRQGVFKGFLGQLVGSNPAELFIVEAVQNPILAEALMRWGWDFDPVVMDFYWFSSKPAAI